jgi:hypothetical protein
MGEVELYPTEFFREFIGLRGKVVYLRPGAPCEGRSIPCALGRAAGAPEEEVRLRANDETVLRRGALSRSASRRWRTARGATRTAPPRSGREWRAIIALVFL